MCMFLAGSDVVLLFLPCSFLIKKSELSILTPLKKRSVMEKVLAENRRLQLLCDKMRKDNHSQPTATALDFFSLDESQLDEPRTLDLTVEGEEVALQMGHKLFVDGILGVSSEFMNKGMNKGNINPTSMFSKHTDPESGKLYYYNKETGKSIWAKEWKKKKMPR